MIEPKNDQLAANERKKRYEINAWLGVAFTRRVNGCADPSD
jgi:hypothetical protein